MMKTFGDDKRKKRESSTEAENDSSNLSESNVGLHDECFVFHQHAEISLEKMELYFLKKQFTDVVIIAGEHRIPAHRLVLSAGSEYFAAMFTNDLREAAQNEIELHNVDGNALQPLIHYCYTGKIEIFKDTVENILVTANLLQFVEVKEACCRFLKKQLHPSNCISIRLFADSQGCIDLMKASHYYTADNFLEVIKNQEFLMLPADEVAKLLASDDLNVSSEESIFQALMSWVEYDITNRREHGSRLLSLVKLPLLSPSFIVDHIETIPLFRDNPECLELILEAFKYHLLPERRSILQSPRTCPRKSTIGDLYALGGSNGSKGAVCVERYDVRLNKWTNFDDMTFSRLQCGVAVVDDKLYVLGGRNGLKTLNTTQCFSMITTSWVALPSMSTPRHGLGVAVLEGFLYVIGGHDGWGYLNTVERWDFQSKNWSYVSPMSDQRSSVGVAVLNGKLYAVGGRDGSSCLYTVEWYDPHTDEWAFCAPMARRRGGVGVGVLNGYLYALGGLESPGANPTVRFPSVERYDPKMDSWTMVASLSSGRDAMGVCVLGQKLFAVGGYDGKNYLKLVEAYDPQKDEWQQMSPLINERAGACVAIIRTILPEPVTEKLAEPQAAK